ncbi:MAG: endonuclease/exonuclease/phosphatase family protein [Planctomycetes bacterium]|nr:endonuclease/exonuclease/phosphatase family protein [Planctomycetota bacterium]
MSTTPATTESAPSSPQRPRKWRVRELGSIGLLLATVAGSCGQWHWLLDLASHFCWYYFVFAGLWLIVTFRSRPHWITGCLGIVLFWNGWLILPHYLPAASPKTPATTLSLVSVNVHTANSNKSAVVDYLRQRQPDMVLVMEIDVEWAAALQSLDDLYPHRLLQPRPDNFGIGLMSKLPLTEPRLMNFGGTGLPSVVAVIRHADHDLQLIGTHPLPPIGHERTSRRNTQLCEIAEFVKRSPLPTIVAGDLNATPWSSAFREFQSRSGLRDSALHRGIHGTWNARTWWLRIPIDHILVPDGAVVVGRNVGRNVGSDHFPVEAQIAFPDL